MGRRRRVCNASASGSLSRALCPVRPCLFRRAFPPRRLHHGRGPGCIRALPALRRRARFLVTLRRFAPPVVPLGLRVLSAEAGVLALGDEQLAAARMLAGLLARGCAGCVARCRRRLLLPAPVRFGRLVAARRIAREQLPGAHTVGHRCALSVEKTPPDVLALPDWTPDGRVARRRTLAIF